MVDEEHLRLFRFYEFQIEKNAMHAVKNICDVFGEDILNVRKCQRWFKLSCIENLSLKNETRSRWVPDFNKNAL